jgi:Ca2+/Na+ antiporter
LIALGWFGFGSTLAGILGALFISYFADKPSFQHSLKTLIMVLLIACLISIVWFELCVHSIFYDRHILSSSVLTIGLSTGLAGLFSGAASPLVYEALAEIMYPLPESLSASILVQWINVVTLVFLFVAPNRDKLVNFLVLVVMVACIILVLITRFTYRRRDEDERKRIEKEQNQAIGDNNLNEATNNYNFDRSLNNAINGPQYGTFAETRPEARLGDRTFSEDSNNWRGVRVD